MTPLKRITWVLLGSSLIAVVLLLVFLDYSLRKYAVEQWVQHRSESVIGLSLVIDDDLEAARDKLQYLTQTPGFGDPLDPSLIKRELNGIPLEVETERRKQLDHFMTSAAGSFNVMFMLLPNGDHYLSHPFSVQQALKTYNISHRPYFQEAEASRKPVISDSFLGADGIPAVAIDVPVLGPDEEINFHLGGVFHLNRAAHLIEKSVPLSVPSFTFLLDRQGTEITRNGGQAEQMDELISEEFFVDFMAESDRSPGLPSKAPVSGIVPSVFSGGENIVVLTRLGCGWVLGSVSDLGSVSAQFDPHIRQTALFLGALFLLISGTAFWMVSRIGLGWQVTDRQTAQALREKETLFQAITNQTSVGVTVADVEGNYTFVNPAFCKMMGYSEEELLQMTVFDMKAASQDTNSFSRSKSSAEGLPIEVFLKRKDGTEFFSEVLGKVIEVGNTQAVLGLVQDITERLKSHQERLQFERKLQHAQKLESLGVLAGGIAHDFNNLLMSILGNADLAQMELTPESPAWENLQEIEIASLRAANLAGQMLAYSGKGRFQIEPLNLGDLIQEIAQLIEVSIAKKVNLVINRAEDLPKFNGDGTQIRQVIMNLITNASEAIEDDSGAISLVTGTRHCDRSFLEKYGEAFPLETSQDLEEGLYVYLKVEDDGCGMSAETRSRVFDPFFTTKFTGRGLGMAAVQGIVRGHNGLIIVESTEGRGSTFQVLFPAGDPTEDVSVPVSKSPDKPEVERASWVGSVLLVDDELMVREVGRKMLSLLGFTVIDAADGLQGLKAFSDNQDQLTCVLLDLTMPVMDGLQTSEKMQAINPKIPIILCSGFTEIDATKKFPANNLAGFIQKPFDLTTLQKELTRVIGVQ